MTEVGRWRLGERGAGGAGPSRRTVIGASLGGAGWAAGPPLIPAGGATAPAPRVAAARTAGEVRLRWFGANAWEIGVAGATVLIDPWLSRYTTTEPGGRFDPGTALRTDPAVIDRHVDRADLVLITHGHYDHIGDVPHLMRRFPGLRAVGTPTHAHLLVGLGVPGERIIVVRGGEYLDFGRYAIRVIPSLHALTAGHRYFAPGTLAAPPARIRTVSDLVEGGTLAYQVTTETGQNLVNIGTANLIEHELAGARPDVAVVAVPFSTTTYRYLERVLAALGRPRWVLPTHHDALDTPLDGPVSAPAGVLSAFRAGVAGTSPGSAVVEPRYAEPITLATGPDGTLRLR